MRLRGWGWLLVLAGIVCGARAQGVAGANGQTATTGDGPQRAASASAAMASARQLFDNREFKRAEAAYRKLTSGPEAALAYARLSEVLLDEAKPEEAYAAVAEAKKLAPNSLDVITAEGEAAFRQGRIAAAEGDFVKAINAKTQNARAYLGLARVSDAEALYLREQSMIDIAKVLSPTDPDIQESWLQTLPVKDEIDTMQQDLANTTNPKWRSDLKRAIRDDRQIEAGALGRCLPQSTTAMARIRLDEMRSGPGPLMGYGLRVKINGITAHLELDTGAEGILLSQNVARRAGLKPVAPLTISGVGDEGPQSGNFSNAQSVRIGNVELKGCQVEIAPRGVNGADGLIGANMLSDFLVDLDMPQDTLKLTPLPARPGDPGRLTSAGALRQYRDRYIAPTMKAYIPVFQFNDQLLFPVLLNDKVPVLFLVDSGSEVDAISTGAARQITGVWAPKNKISGLNGNVNRVHSSNSVTLTFAHFRQQNLSMTTFDLGDLSKAMGTELSGLLGLETLRRFDVKIDYRDGLIDFNYRP